MGNKSPAGQTHKLGAHLATWELARHSQQMFPANMLWIALKSSRQNIHLQAASALRQEEKVWCPKQAPIIHHSTTTPPTGWSEADRGGQRIHKEPMGLPSKAFGLEWEAREMGGWSEGCSHTQGGGEEGWAADEIPGKAPDWDGGASPVCPVPLPDGCSWVRMQWAVCSAGWSPSSCGLQSFCSEPRLLTHQTGLMVPPQRSHLENSQDTWSL